MKNLLKLSLVFLFLIESVIGLGQSDIIYPKNGSLEGKPKDFLFMLVD